MTDLDRERVSDQDGFEYGYRVFIEAVDALALEPSAQVRQNGNYNTAFELIHDACSGRYLVESSASYLSEDQRQLANDFVYALEGLPFGSRHSGRQPLDDDRLDANLTDMLHPCWGSIRAKAVELQQKLAGPSALNAAFFRSL